MAQAVEANLFAFFQYLANWPRVEFHDDRDCCWTLSDLPFPLFNSVMRSRVPDEHVEAMIESRVEACRTRNVPMLWWTGPSSLRRPTCARGWSATVSCSNRRSAWPSICWPIRRRLPRRIRRS